MHVETNSTFIHFWSKKELSIEFSNTNKKLQNQTVKDIKSVGSTWETWLEFQIRDKSLLKIILAFVGYQVSNAKTGWILFLKLNTPQRISLFDYDLGRKNEACSYE